MNVKEMFDKIDKELKAIDDVMAKEKSYISADSNWVVSLYYNDWVSEWRVVVYYLGVVMIRKPFEKYEDALKFYDSCVSEIKKRYENREVSEE